MVGTRVSIHGILIGSLYAHIGRPSQSNYTTRVVYMDNGRSRGVRLSFDHVAVISHIAISSYLCCFECVNSM